MFKNLFKKIGLYDDPERRLSPGRANSGAGFYNSGRANSGAGFYNSGRANSGAGFYNSNLPKNSLSFLSSLTRNPIGFQNILREVGQWDKYEIILLLTAINYLPNL